VQLGPVYLFLSFDRIIAGITFGNRVAGGIRLSRERQHPDRSMPERFCDSAARSLNVLEDFASRDDL
jgi:hypothetical protein